MSDIVERLRHLASVADNLRGRRFWAPYMKKAAAEIERLRALMPEDPRIAELEARIAQLEKDGAALSAWQCIHMDWKTGITSDDHGNQYCAKDRRNPAPN